WGVLEVVLSNDAGLPEAAATIQRLVTRWNVPHEQITFDKLGIGRNFPNHLARYGITTAIPCAGGPLPSILLWALPTPSDSPAGFLLLLWRLLCPAGRRAAALDLQPDRQKDQAHAEGRVGDHPGTFARC